MKEYCGEIHESVIESSENSFTVGYKASAPLPINFGRMDHLQSLETRFEAHKV
jgi:hypothetical protein